MEEKIKTWKEKYGKDAIFEITVKKGDEKIIGYFRKPNLEIISAAAKVGGGDEIKAGMVLFENCWLDGDIRLQEDDELKVSCLSKLSDLFKIFQADVKKL